MQSNKAYLSQSCQLIGRTSLLCSLPFCRNINHNNITSSSARHGDVVHTVIFNPSAVVKRSRLMSRFQVGWGAIKVAVLDSGRPPDIIPTAEMDFSGTGMIDRKGHGTFIIRIIKHLAPAVQLLVGKIGNEQPSEGAVIRGLKWAVLNDAQIINLSCGGIPKDKKGARIYCEGICTVAKEINSIVDNTSCIVTIAAGNNGPNDNSINCPACAEKAVTVGSIDSIGKLGSYSGRGKPGFNKPNILAPGDVVVDLKPDYGTSYAAPIIAGILAATLNMFNTTEDAIQALYGTAQPLGYRPFEEGHGLIDLDKYLEVMDNGRANSRSKGKE